MHNKDNCTGHKQGRHGSAQHCCRVQVAEGDLAPQVETPGKTLHFAPQSTSLMPAAEGGQGGLGDTDTAALGSVFQPAARAFQELQNGLRF